ncbi:MAG: U32 family peptidase C-terminal domain-containing protein [Succinivibrio sp.]|nr:U32 family peptidase C-terminal domain-containing protein [Succinivibrio sp.]
MKRPELLAPAGSLTHLRWALKCGADAVYAGVPRWSLRVRGNGFGAQDFNEGIALAHAWGKRFYAVVNTIPHERSLPDFKEAILKVAACGPDALIMADPGLILLTRQAGVTLPLHLSVQANTVNSAAVAFWQHSGVSRCILSRELSLGEIALIREHCPEMELEVFVHGAMCVARSGRCLISGLLSRRDANTGACNNFCRSRFKLHGLGCNTPEGGAAADGSSEDDFELTATLAEQDHRPQEILTLKEDAQGSYLFNAHDLCALPLLRELCEIGVDSLKIEGRSRSPFYSAATSLCYSRALDALLAGLEVPGWCFEFLHALPGRPLDTGLLKPKPAGADIDYTQGSPYPGSWRLCGEVTGQLEDGRLLITVKNRFDRGDALLLFTPLGLKILESDDLRDSAGKPVPSAPGAGYVVTLPCPHALSEPPALILRCERLPLL